MSERLPSILEELDFTGIKKIDVALEGNWSQSVVTVWTKNNGFVGFSNVVNHHKYFKPSIELYFSNSWIGIHCYKKSYNDYIFDEQYAIKIIKFIEAKIKKNNY